MRYIGICGNINAGKDSVAAILEAEYGYTRRAYSDPVYQILLTLNPLIPINIAQFPGTYGRYTMRVQELVQFYGLDFVKRNSPEVRKYLRLLGTECGRDVFGQDCWVDKMAEDSLYDEKTVITGIRFQNEVDFIRENGGVIWLVSSTREIPADPSHISEMLNYASVYDYWLRNDGDLAQLRQTVKQQYRLTLQDRNDGLV
jgi:dephospho-CoA kinase